MTTNNLASRRDEAINEADRNLRRLTAATRAVDIRRRLLKESQKTTSYKYRKERQVYAFVVAGLTCRALFRSLKKLEDVGMKERALEIAKSIESIVSESVMKATLAIEQGDKP